MEHQNGTATKHDNGKCEDKKVAQNGTSNGHATVSNSALDADQIAVAVATDAGTLLPHLESIERLMKLPVVEATWNQSQDVYGRVKGTFSIHARNYA